MNFLDTNVVVYGFINDSKTTRAQALLDGRPAISVQVLNEFIHVARRKFGVGWSELRTALEVLRSVCRVVAPIDIGLHNEAVRIAQRYGFTIYDSLIVAAALSAGCEVLYTEDLSHGQVIDGKLRVTNPFVDA